MAFEDKQAEIGLLLTRLQDEPHNQYELHLQLMEKLNGLKAFGLPLPDDLVKLKSRLEVQFAAEKRQR